MKKIIGLIAVTVMFLQSICVASALTVTDIDDAVTVTGQTDENNAGKRVSLVVLKPGFSELSDVDADNAEDKVYYFAQDVVAEDGSYDFTVAFYQTATSGDYSFYTAVEGEAGIVDDGVHYFMGLDKKNEIRDLANGSAESVKTALDTLLGIIDAAPEDAAAEKTELATIVMELRGQGEFASFEDCRQAVCLALIKKNILDQECTVSLLEALAAEAGLAVDPTLFSLVENEKQMMSDAIRGVVPTKENMVKLFADNGEKCALNKINTADRESIEDIVIVYQEILTVTDEEIHTYKNLNEQKKMIVNIEIANRGFTSIDGFLTSFRKGLREAAEENIDDSSSGGKKNNGGGSGGGGTVSVSANVPNEKPSVKTFRDIDNIDWAKEAIEVFAEKEIINGTSADTFEPNAGVTREQFVKMLVNVCGVYDADTECEFADTQKGEWHYSYIASAKNTGLANGISEDVFGVGVEISRQDMVVMVKRAADKMGIVLPKGSADEFSDADIFADYAAESIRTLQQAGIVNGKDENAFCPFNSCTRAEATVILYRLYKLL